MLYWIKDAACVGRVRLPARTLLVRICVCGGCLGVYVIVVTSLEGEWAPFLNRTFRHGD